MCRDNQPDFSIRFQSNHWGSNQLHSGGRGELEYPPQFLAWDGTSVGWVTSGDSLQTETGLGNSGFVPTVCAHFACNGAYYSFTGSPAFTQDSQALGGTGCIDAYNNYIGGTDLNPPIGSWPSQAAISFYNPRRRTQIITLECGVNDWIHGNTAAQAFTGITNFVTAAKATGYTVFVATLTDSCHIYLGGGETTFRAALNTSIRNGAAGQGYTVVDYAANTNIGSDGASQNTTYFQTPEGGCATGGVHLTAAGVAIQAGIMEAAMTAAGVP
jgi:hypothetical protein